MSMWLWYCMWLWTDDVGGGPRGLSSTTLPRPTTLPAPYSIRYGFKRIRITALYDPFIPFTLGTYGRGIDSVTIDRTILY